MISPLTCPICNKPVNLEGNKSMPFCSQRCRSIDLGRWFGEEIGVPLEPGTAASQQQPLEERGDA